MPHDEFQIVPYEPRFKEQVVQLQTHLWSRDLTMNRAYLEWKYEQCPYLTRPLIQLAFCGGDLVGMRGFYGGKWSFGSPPRTVVLLSAGDTVITPAHRNRGLFPTLIRLRPPVFAGHGNVCLDYLLNLSASRVTMVASLFGGSRSAGDLQRWTWRNNGANADAGELVFHQLDRSAGRESRAGTVWMGTAPQPEAMAELIRRIPRDGRLRHARDEEFFRWRFQNPLCEYRFLFWEETRLEAYLVVQTFRTTMRKPQVNVVDWAATTDQAFAELLEAALRRGAFHLVHTWTATAQPEHVAVLQQMGFAQCDSGRSSQRLSPTPLIRALRPHAEDDRWHLGTLPLLDISSWDLRMIDSDGY